MKKVLLSVLVLTNAMMLDLKASSLLANFDTVGWGFGAGETWYYQPAVEYKFVLGYGFPETPGPDPFDLMIGKSAAIGTTLTGYDFDSSNSPTFGALTSKITDSASETLYAGMYLYTANGTILSGIGFGNSDTDLFGIPTDWNIDKIALLVNDSSTSANVADGRYRVDYTFNLTWQIWGSGTPVTAGAARVPDAGSTVGLVGMSLFIIVAARRRSIRE